MTHMGPHLNDEQFAECVLLTIDPECANHLAVCERCREELETFTASVDAFNQASMAWSEAQPSVSLRGRAESRARREAFVPAGWVLAAAAVVAIAVPVMNHEQRGSQSRDAVASVSQDDSTAQIADDDRLMRSVNVALAANEPSPLSEYGLSGESSGPARLRKGSRGQ